MALSMQQVPAIGRITRRAGEKRPPYGLLVTGAILTLVAVFLPPALAAVALVGIGLGAVMLARPEIALYVLIFAIPYGSVRNVQAGGLNVGATEFAALCGGAAFLMQGAMRGRFRVPWAWWSGPLLLFIGVAMVSATGATSFALSLKEILKMGEWLIAYLLVLSYVDTPAKLKRLLFILVLAATSQALYGLAQTFAHAGPSSFVRAGALRASGTFDQPNPFAGYINFTLPILLAGVITGTRIVGRWTGPAALILSAALLASGSRGAWLALLAALAVMLLVYVPRARILIAVAVIAVVAFVIGAVFGLVPSSLTTLALDFFGVSNVSIANPTPLDWSTAERLAHQLAGIYMFLAHPILGVGIGNYPAAYPKYQVAPVWVNPLGHAHNYYINIAAEAGIVGLVAFLVVIITAFVILARLYRRSKDPWARAIVLGAVGVLVTVVVHNNFDNVFVHEMEAQFGLIIGIATVACRLGAVDRRQSLTAGSRELELAASGA